MSILCPYRGLSYASLRLHTLSRVFLSVDLPNNSLTRRSFSTSRQEQDQEAKSPSPPPADQINGSERKPQPSDRLPRSPILARKARAAQMRQKRPNLNPGSPDPLRHNPWARILASPARMCRVTRARMPSDLLVDFGLVKYPEASSYWLMPTKLLKDELRDLALKPAVDNEAGGEKEQSSREPPPKTSITNSAKVLDALKGIRSALLVKLFREKSKYPSGPLTKQIMNNMVWREDMADFVLQQLRWNATKKLKTSSLSDASPKVTPESWMVLDVKGSPGVEQLEEALEKLGDMENKSWGAVLVLGPRTENQGPTAEAEEPNVQNNPLLTDEHASLPDLIKLPGGSAKVPIFDLRTLLSEDNISDLQACHHVFHHNVLFFRAIKHISPDPLVALMQLKGYMSDGDDFST